MRSGCWEVGDGGRTGKVRKQYGLFCGALDPAGGGFGRMSCKKTREASLASEGSARWIDKRSTKQMVAHLDGNDIPAHQTAHLSQVCLVHPRLEISEPDAPLLPS
jgi:hypothetical protein